jgi:hypothetical protein
MEENMVKAGEGEHQASLIQVSDDKMTLTVQKHYLAIDAVSWFINQESSWFKDRMATGTISIKIGNSESYHVALGLYELKGGARIAPVFGRPVLPERAFRGGPVTVQVIISGLSKTTGIGKVLQGVADAALGVVGTMVQTATLAGPSQVLTSAGSSLVGGVRELLNNQDKSMRLFDPTTGIEKTVQPSDLRGPVTYLLLHRGTTLDQKRLKIGTGDDTDFPVYDGRRLEDGVWILLRFRRTREYPAEPVWLGKVRDWIAQVEQLADNLRAGAMSAEDARTKLTVGGDGESSLYDSYREVSALIRADALLTSMESGSYLGVLRAARLLSLRLVNSGDWTAFEQTMTALREGALTDAELRAAVVKAAEEAAQARGAATSKPKLGIGMLGDQRETTTLPFGEFPRLQSVLSGRQP